MKFFIFILTTLVLSVPAYSQQISLAMRDYMDGCFLLGDAIATKDFGKLIDAKQKFDNIKLESISETDILPMDSLSKSTIMKPTILFTPEFASDLVKTGEITLSEIDNFHMMRKGRADLFLWHASIAPVSSASFRCEGEGTCELLLCSLPEANLKLTITSQCTGAIDCIPIGVNNAAWYASWDMPQKGEFYIFTITNNSLDPASFVIAFN